MSEALLQVEGLTKHFPITRGLFRRTVGTIKNVNLICTIVIPVTVVGMHRKDIGDIDSTVSVEVRESDAIGAFVA